MVDPFPTSLGAGHLEKLLVYANPLVVSKLEIIDLCAYQPGILYREYSHGVAVSILKSVVSLTLLFLANYLSKLVRKDKIL